MPFPRHPIRDAQPRSMHAAATIVLVGALLAAGWGSAITANTFDLLSGALWVPSSIGQVALLSGGSTRTVASIAVADAGDDLEVAQSGPDGYVVDHTRGTVRRVSGATFDAGAPVTFADDGSKLQVLVNGPHLWVLDGARGLAYRVNAESLQAVGSAVTLAADVRPDSALVDGAGRLWVVDDRTGDVAWADTATHRRKGAVSGNVGTLVSSGGRVVLVGSSGAEWLGEDGTATSTVDFGLRAGEHAIVSGTDTGSLLVVVAERGLLEVCTEKGCGSQAYPLVTGHSLGRAVAYDGQYVVPDYTSGSVYVVRPDSADAPVVGHILDPAALFALTARDTVLFYNDRASNRAGIIRVDGSHVAFSKYDPKHPKADLDTGTKHAKPPALTPPKINRPKPSATATPTPNSTPGKGTPPPAPSNNGPGGNTPSSTSTPSPGTPTSSSTPPPPSFTINAAVTPRPGVEGQPVQLAVHSANGVMSSCTWRIDAGSTPAPCTQPITAPAAGAHTVLVDATSSTGSPASWQTPLSVTTPVSAPDLFAIDTIAFTPTPIMPGAAVGVVVTYQSGPAAACTWNINGASEVGCDQTQTVGAAGTRNATVYATSPKGHFFHKSALLVVQPAPPGKPDIDVPAACLAANTDATITAQGSGQVDSWHWSADHMVSSSGNSLTMHPVTEGSYAVSVYTSNSTGNSPKDSVNVTFCDVTPPVLSIHQGQPGSTVRVTLTATDDESTVTSSGLTVSFEEYSPCSGTSHPFGTVTSTTSTGTASVTSGLVGTCYVTGTHPHEFEDDVVSVSSSSAFAVSSGGRSTKP